MTYHGFNVRVRYGVKLRKLELVVGADVYVGAPVFCHVTVFRGRKD